MAHASRFSRITSFCSNQLRVRVSPLDGTIAPKPMCFQPRHAVHRSGKLLHGSPSQTQAHTRMEDVKARVVDTSFEKERRHRQAPQEPPNEDLEMIRFEALKHLYRYAQRARAVEDGEPVDCDRNSKLTHSANPPAKNSAFAHVDLYGERATLYCCSSFAALQHQHRQANRQDEAAHAT